MFADARVYMADDILTKVDRASMSVALEARVPILDHRVVRYALSLPRSLCWHGGVTKAPLREIAFRRIPRALLERPKRGFGIPIETLLADELARWPARYLAPARLAEEGILDPAATERLLAGVRRAGPEGLTPLWFLLCFERWFARTHRGEASAD
jgi:asparagine synthase (glutamine-hydrolysing)